MKNSTTTPATTTTTFEVSWTPKTQSRMPGYTGKKTLQRIARFTERVAAQAACDFLHINGFQDVKLNEIGWHKHQTHLSNFATFAKCFH